MKKSLLLLGTLFMTYLGQAQIITFVENPPSLMGNYDFTWAEPSGGWGCPDLSDPANAITDTLAFVDDGTAGDSLGCNALVNGTDITGKIAVIYRGACEFGTKALNAENAGAVGAIIVNNVPGAPVGMAPGTDGVNVTIPLIMISQADGAALASEIANGNVVAFIGSKSGFYGNDAGVYPADVKKAKAFSTPLALAADASEYSVPLGAWVRNYGANDLTGVTLNATIDMGGSNIYNETSAPVDIPSGDSAEISLTDFSQSSYTAGLYELTYTVASDSTDEFIDDNVVESDFMLNDSLYSVGGLDSINNPLNTDFYRPSGGTGSYSACIHFQDPNASRIAVMGLTFSASGGLTPDFLDGEYFEIYCYSWDDQFTGLSDAGYDNTIANRSQVAFAEYLMDGDLQDSNVYAPFNAPFQLEDDTRYLFCVTTYNDSVYLGYDGDMDYTYAQTIYDQPLSPIQNGSTWNGVGFGPDVIAAISVNVSTSIGIIESTGSNITPYPNPTQNQVIIPLDLQGMGQMTVRDIAGKVVIDERVALSNNNKVVDLSSFENGTYIFTITLHDGSVESFKVMLNK